jgi:hypothetical protein
LAVGTMPTLVPLQDGTTSAIVARWYPKLCLEPIPHSPGKKIMPRRFWTVMT